MNKVLALFALGCLVLCISTNYIAQAEKTLREQNDNNHNATNATAEILYVSSYTNISQDNGNDCKNASHPCATINYALQLIRPPGHLWLDGEFHLQSTLQIQTAGITIESDPNKPPALINCSLPSNPGQRHNGNGIEVKSIVNLIHLEIVECAAAVVVDIGSPNDPSHQVLLKGLVLHDNLIGISSKQSGLIIDDCSVYNNSLADVQNVNGKIGGGLYLEQGTATIMNSRIYNNSGSNKDKAGGGLYSFQSRIILLNTLIFNNNASDRGGGLYFFGGEIFIRNVSVFNNTVLNGASLAGGSGSNNPVPFGGGGGIYLNSGTVNMTDTRVYGNIIQNYLGQTNGGSNNIIQFANGGGIYIDSSTYYSKNTSFYDNQVLQGNLSNQDINNNTNPGGPQDQVMRIGRSGGGIYISQASIVMYDTYVTSNYAFGSIDGFSGGGGLYIDRGTNIFYGLQVSYNTITQGGGAGIYSSHGTTIIYGEGPLQPGQPCNNPNNITGICTVSPSFVNYNALLGDGKLQTNQNSGDSGDIGGGGILAEKATFVLYHVEVSNNLVSPYGQGGAMKINLATIVGYNISCVNNTVVVHNTSSLFSNLHDDLARGGGAVLNRSSLQFMNVTFRDNRVVLFNESILNNVTSTDPSNRYSQPESDVVCFESTVVIYTPLSYVNSSRLSDNSYCPIPPPLSPYGPTPPPYPYGPPNPPYYGPCNPWNPLNPCPNDTTTIPPYYNNTNPYYNNTNPYYNNTFVVKPLDYIGVDCDVCTVYYDGLLECDGNVEQNYTLPVIDPINSIAKLKHPAPLSPSKFSILRANKIYEILIYAKDVNNNTDYMNRADWDIHIYSNVEKKFMKEPVLSNQVKIADLNNGTYAVYFYLIQNGDYSIYVKSGVKELKNSPIKIQIVDGIEPDSSGFFWDSSSSSGDVRGPGRRWNEGWVWLVALAVVGVIGVMFTVGIVVILNRKEGRRLRGEDVRVERQRQRQDNNSNTGNSGNTGGGRSYGGREAAGYGTIRGEDDEEHGAAESLRTDRRDVSNVVVEEDN